LSGGMVQCGVVGNSEIASKPMDDRKHP
jgi:hypothetical protein